MVEPIDPVERGQCDRFDRAPRSTSVDDLGLVETDDRLGQGSQSYESPTLPTDGSMPVSAKRSV